MSFALTLNEFLYQSHYTKAIFIYLNSASDSAHLPLKNWAWNWLWSIKCWEERKTNGKYKWYEKDKYFVYLHIYAHIVHVVEWFVQWKMLLVSTSEYSEHQPSDFDQSFPFLSGFVPTSSKSSLKPSYIILYLFERWVTIRWRKMRTEYNQKRVNRIHSSEQHYIHEYDLTPICALQCIK